MPNYEDRIRYLAETTRLSNAKICAVLKEEGHSVSLSTVGRRVSQLRNRSTHPPRAKTSKAQRAVVPPVPGVEASPQSLTDVLDQLSEPAEEFLLAYLEGHGARAVDEADARLRAILAKMPACPSCGGSIDLYAAREQSRQMPGDLAVRDARPTIDARELEASS